MALVASVQCLAPLLNTMLTSKWPQVHIQHRHAGDPSVPHSWALGSDVSPQP